MLQIYNSLTRQKETFTPIEANKVNMYVCGMTVYDYCHLGHARVLVVFDMVYRYLQALGYKVNYARNITDIDDKIIRRAAENKEDIYTLTQRFITAMHEDEKALGILRPTVEPRATDNISAMLTMIQTLIDKGLAYAGQNGDVYYDVSEFNDYGKLSGRKLEELRAGERIAIDEVKTDPLDFVLWKAAKAGEPSWDSPWGKGRPGWHIECSAMSQSLFGHCFDIHGGGHDLQFPHHENEIAQSEGCTGHTMVNYWMHNGFVRINQEKMSKSLGNFFTIREILQHYKAEEVRFFMLNGHYRSPLNYSAETLDGARTALNRLYTALRGISTISETATQPVVWEKNPYEPRFHQAMQDDFNTPEALAVLFDLAREVNRLRQENHADAPHAAALLRQLATVLGLLQTDAEVWFKGNTPVDGLGDADIEALMQQRLVARQNKDWATADQIRQTLQQHNIVLEDNAGQTTWRRA